MPKAPEPSSTCQKTTKSLPRISPKSYCYNAVPNRFLAHFSTSRTNGPRLFSRVKAGTPSAFGEGSHTAAYTPKQGAFRMGVVSLLSERSARSPTSPGRVSERQVLPLLGLGRGCSQRTQKAFGTAMRLCASLFRGVAAPLGCVIFFASAEIAVCTSYAQGFLRVRGEGWYHYPQRALRAVETPDTRLSKRLICRFLRSGGRSSPHDFYFLANMQVSLSENSVATTFALWYNKSKELEEFQNNYAVKFPFAIASSSPGPRPKQQKGSAIP